MNNIILLGSTGSGKNYIQDYIIKNYGYKKGITYTTRPKRENETNGKDYYFISKEEFLEKEKEGFFLEVKKYNTIYGCWYYGCPKNLVNEEKTIIILDKEGFLEYNKYNNCNSIYLSVPNKTERYYRALKRMGNIPLQQANDELYRRINDDNQKFKEVKKIVDYIVPQFYNDDTLNVVDDIMSKIGE